VRYDEVAVLLANITNEGLEVLIVRKSINEQTDEVDTMIFGRNGSFHSRDHLQLVLVGSFHCSFYTIDRIVIGNGDSIQARLLCSGEDIWNTIPRVMRVLRVDMEVDSHF
jgi:hypothetical protein